MPLNLQIPYECSVDSTTVTVHPALVSYQNITTTVTCPVSISDLSGIELTDAVSINTTAFATFLETVLSSVHLIASPTFPTYPALPTSLSNVISNHMFQTLPSAFKLLAPFAVEIPVSTIASNIATAIDISGTLQSMYTQFQTVDRFFQAGDSLSFLLVFPLSSKTITVPVPQNVGAHIIIRNSENTVPVTLPPLPSCSVVFKIQFI